MPSNPPPAVVHLSTPTPFAWPALRSYLASRAIPGLEHVDDTGYVRSARVHDRVVVVALRPRGERAPALVVAGEHRRHIDALVELAGRALALAPAEAMPPAGEVLGADPDLAPLVAARPHLRVPGTWDPFETGVRAIVGQQVSVAGAATITGRIVHRHGAPIAIDPADGTAVHVAARSLTHAFPTPAALAEGDLSGLGLTNARRATIHGFAQAVTAGDIRLAHDTPLDELIGSITAHRGLGPWTAHYIALRLGHADAFPSGDLALRRALSPNDPPSARELEERSARWRPWRALAAAHLWAEDAARRPASRFGETTAEPVGTTVHLVRRRSGNQLVVNERRVLAGALRLANSGSSRLYGYELFSLLRTWEGHAPMDHGTLYRCLRKLEARGYFSSQVELADPSTRRVRVYYSLTPSGTAAAQVAARELAESPAAPAWVELGLGWES